MQINTNDLPRGPTRDRLEHRARERERDARQRDWASAARANDPEAVELFVAAGDYERRELPRYMTGDEYESWLRSQTTEIQTLAIACASNPSALRTALLADDDVIRWIRVHRAAGGYAHTNPKTLTQREANKLERVGLGHLAKTTTAALGYFGDASTIKYPGMTVSDVELWKKEAWDVLVSIDRELAAMVESGEVTVEDVDLATCRAFMLRMKVA